MTGRRDAAIKAVVQEWQDVQPRPFVMPKEMTALAIALDELTAAVDDPARPVDMAARLRVAAGACTASGDLPKGVTLRVESHLRELANHLKWYPNSPSAQAIARALTGETA